MSDDITIQPGYGDVPTCCPNDPHHAIWFVFAAIALLLIAACDSGPRTPGLDGNYSGVFSYVVDDSTLSEDWSLDLAESADGVMGGTGMLGASFVIVRGSHTHPDVTLRFLEGGEDFAGTFTGSLSEDGNRLSGVYNHSVTFVETPVVLVRRSL